MSDKRGRPHPDLDRLLDLELGRVEDADESSRLAAHLAECPRCRLELARLRDFQGADLDEDALAAADWERAELVLQRRFERDLRPSRGGAEAETVPSAERREPGLAPRRRWLAAAPLAAAAVLAVLFFSLDRFPQPGPGGGGDTLRGGETTAPGIELVAPLEQVAAPPAEFVWSSAEDFDSYVLEVFSPDLESVLRLADLRGRRVTLPDSLVARLEPGRTYLWNVQGRSGLADGELSLTAWFRIGPPLRKPAPQGGGGSPAQ